MEDLQTDTLCDYSKNQNQENTDLDPKRDGDCAANLLNGCDDIDPLDLMADNCDNESIGSNSDVWKGSDSEEETFENRGDNINENVVSSKPIEEISNVSEVGNSGEKEGTPTTEEKDTISPEHNEDEQTAKENIQSSELKEMNSKKNEDEISIVEEENGNSEKKTVNESLEEKSELTTNKDSEEKEVEKSSQSMESNEKIVSDDGNEIISTDNENKEKEKETEVEKANETEKESPGNTENKETGKQPPGNTENKETEKESSGKTGNKETEKDSDADVVEVSDKDPLDDVVEIVEKDPLAEDPEQKDMENPPIEENKDSAEGRPPNRLIESQDDDVEMDYDADDDGFDPSLFMPEVSMDVDENPVVTTNGGMPHEGERGDSPSLCEPVFSTFVDEVTGAEISFNLTAEEQELRKRLYGPTNPIQMTRIHCTACNVHLGSALEGQNNRFVHPLLKVLICKECYHFYTSGDFDKDEDGSELYCRWCGQGGQVLCCSKCEFVFCKRCIRTNFGRKKMFEIRDSDSWDCFRCNGSQIITQRIACYEFFEYVRREMSRAATLNNTSEVWSTDYSRCCNNKKRSAENSEEVKKPKRKKGDVDPDYNPLVDIPPLQPTLSGSPTVVTSTNSSSAVIITPKSGAPANKPLILPKPIVMSRYVNKSKDNDIEFVRQIPPPHVTVNTTRPAYRTILPTTVRPVGQSSQPPTLVRIGQPVPPLVTSSNRILGNALQNRNTSPSMMKHEWFEKTVRAAARVNSHLSYTLTQLNKAQSQAASVEELAVVHNKLQEILSSSINSLIQIRKNLRTEFIAGIKTVRLPSKKVETFNNDDDVIFVSAPTIMPMPSTSQVRTAPKDPFIIIDKTNSTNTPKPTPPVSTEKPRLKVKSVMELQNVPSECITIPDDTPTPFTQQSETPKPSELYNGKVEEPAAEVDPLGDIPVVDISATASSSRSDDIRIIDQGATKTANGEKSSDGKNTKENGPTREMKRRSKNSLVHHLPDKPTPEIKKMMAVKVNLERVDLQELQKKLSNEGQ